MSKYKVFVLSLKECEQFLPCAREFRTLRCSFITIFQTRAVLRILYDFIEFFLNPLAEIKFLLVKKKDTTERDPIEANFILKIVDK